MNERSGDFHRALVGMRWVAASKVMVQASTWVLTILAVRLLQPSDYGIVTMSGLVTVLLNLALEGGVGISIVQKREADRATLANLSLVMVSCATLVCLLLVLVAPLFARFFHEPALTDVLRVASLQFPLSALLVVPAAMLTREMRFRELAVSQTVAAVVQGLSTVALAYAGQAYWALVWSTLIGLVVRNSMLHYFARPPMTLRWSAQLLAPYLHSGRLLLGQRFIWFAVEETDRFLVARSLGVSGTGTYTVAKTLSHTFLERIAEVVNQVSLPAFAAKQDDTEAWNRGLLRLQSFAGSLAFPLFWGLAAVAPTVLPLLIGARWSGAVPAFTLFCLVLPLRVWYALTDVAMLAAGKNYLSLRNILIWPLILVPLFVLALPHGINLVAAGWAVGFPIVFAIVSRRIARAVGIGWGTMVKTMAEPACYAAIMFVVVFGVGWLLAGHVHPFLEALIQVVIGVACYFGSMWVFNRERCTELFQLVRKFIGR